MHFQTTVSVFQAVTLLTYVRLKRIKFTRKYQISTTVINHRIIDSSNRMWFIYKQFTKLLPFKVYSLMFTLIKASAISKILRFRKIFRNLILIMFSLAPDDPIDNTRYKKLSFTAAQDSVIHGFSGFFDTVLYKDVVLSIVPETYSEGMFSWFPIFFPIKVSYSQVLRNHIFCAFV